MNERTKGLVKDIAMNAIFAVAAVGGMYLFNPLLFTKNIVKIFNDTESMGKVFIVLFGLVTVYNIFIVVKKYMSFNRTNKPQIVHDTSPVSGQQLKKPAESAPIQKTDLPQAVVNNPPVREVQDYSNPENSVFDKFDEEIEKNFNVDAGDMGQGMMNSIKRRVNRFNDKMDLDITTLEEEYVEMDKLKKEIEGNVDGMYEEYGKLKQQMQITNGMIKTKRMLKERINLLKK